MVFLTLKGLLLSLALFVALVHAEHLSVHRSLHARILLRKHKVLRHASGTPLAVLVAGRQVIAHYHHRRHGLVLSSVVYELRPAHIRLRMTVSVAVTTALSTDHVHFLVLCKIILHKNVVALLCVSPSRLHRSGILDNLDLIFVFYCCLLVASHY